MQRHQQQQMLDAESARMIIRSELMAYRRAGGSDDGPGATCLAWCNRCCCVPCCNCCISCCLFIVALILIYFLIAAIMWRAKAPVNPITGDPVRPPQGTGKPVTKRTPPPQPSPADTDKPKHRVVITPKQGGAKPPPEPPSPEPKTPLQSPPLKQSPPAAAADEPLDTDKGKGEL